MSYTDNVRTHLYLSCGHSLQGSKKYNFLSNSFYYKEKCIIFVLSISFTNHYRTMSDTHTSEQRHANMAAIHGKNTKPEMVVRRWLWAHGFRYRVNHPRLPGKPDIVLRKYKTCIFVNGCFWHGHHTQFIMHSSQFIIESSDCCKIPKTNRSFWVSKIMRNKERDLKVQQQLATMGWHCITVWECELKPKVREKTLESLAYTLNSIFLQDHRIRRYEMPEEESMMAAEE